MNKGNMTIWQKGLIAVLFFNLAAASNAITLEQYGLTVTSSGFVDNVTGLRWLDADLTQGTVATIDSLLSQGWRVASESELRFLLSRELVSSEVIFNYTGNNPLQYDQFLILLAVLGIFPNEEFTASWMCRNYGDVTDQCSNAFSPSFEQPFVFAQEDYTNVDEFGPTTTIQIYTYITEAYLYGSYSTPCPDCTGRAILVRPVPLPASIWAFLAAVGLLRILRRS